MRRAKVGTVGGITPQLDGEPLRHCTTTPMLLTRIASPGDGQFCRESLVIRQPLLNAKIARKGRRQPVPRNYVKKPQPGCCRHMMIGHATGLHRRPAPRPPGRCAAPRRRGSREHPHRPRGRGEGLTSPTRSGAAAAPRGRRCGDHPVLNRTVGSRYRWQLRFCRRARRRRFGWRASSMRRTLSSDATSQVRGAAVEATSTAATGFGSEPSADVRTPPSITAVSSFSTTVTGAPSTPRRL